jgi:hypothetical protein
VRLASNPGHVSSFSRAKTGTGAIPIGPRRKLWARLGDSLRPRQLAEITSDVDVKDFIGVLDQVRAGAFSGRRWCGLRADSELAVAYSKG